MNDNELSFNLISFKFGANHFLTLMKNLCILLFSMVFWAAGFVQGQVVSINFNAEDGLSVKGDLYEANEEMNPVMLLCHQARYSRGEYQETAKKFQEMGYSCLAIDQRSGDQVNGIINETARLAREKEMEDDYLDAVQDIEAGIEYLYNKYQKPVILVGSSYSASLVLKIAKEDERVLAVISFSPGEYFGDQLNLTETITGLEKPVFLTSSKKEAPAVEALTKGIRSSLMVHFIPKSKGFHGSKALWEENVGNEEYWNALTGFLEKLKAWKPEKEEDQD